MTSALDGYFPSMLARYPDPLPAGLLSTLVTHGSESVQEDLSGRPDLSQAQARTLHDRKVCKLQRTMRGPNPVEYGNHLEPGPDLDTFIAEMTQAWYSAYAANARRPDPSGPWEVLLSAEMSALTLSRKAYLLTSPHAVAAATMVVFATELHERDQLTGIQHLQKLLPGLDKLDRPVVAQLMRRALITLRESDAARGALAVLSATSDAEMDGVDPSDEDADFTPAELTHVLHLSVLPWVRIPTVRSWVSSVVNAQAGHLRDSDLTLLENHPGARASLLEACAAARQYPSPQLRPSRSANVLDLVLAASANVPVGGWLAALRLLEQLPFDVTAAEAAAVLEVTYA